MESIKESAFFGEPSLSTVRTAAKTLLLFFDEITLLIPSSQQARDYLRRDLREVPEFLRELTDRDLLRVTRANEVVDDTMARSLLEIGENLPRSRRDAIAERYYRRYEEHGGTLDLGKFGGPTSADVAQRLFDLLKEKNLATRQLGETLVGVDENARDILLAGLIQLIAAKGSTPNVILNPVFTSSDARSILKQARWQFQDIRKLVPGMGEIVQSEVMDVGVDLSSVPLEEVLAFRAQHGREHRQYMANLRRFVVDVAQVDGQKQTQLLVERHEELRDAANDLRRLSRQTWRRPATFGLGIAGTAASVAQGDWIAAGLTLAGSLLAIRKEERAPTVFGYLLDARGLGPRY